MNWQTFLRGKVKPGEPLKRHTTFKIGGPVKFFIAPKDSADLKLLLKLAKRYRIPALIIGKGSNILAADIGLNAAVIALSSPFFKRLTFKNSIVEAAAGCSLSEVILAAQKRGLGGLEFLAGIPGTVGGALVMNAGEGKDGWHIADFIRKVKVMDYQGKIKTLNKRALKFGYRKSNLGKYIVLGVSLKLRKESKQDIQNKLKNSLMMRRRTQDMLHASAGCIFKNSRQFSAGKLIDLCGLKNKRVGQAAISERHANFIINIGNACAKDVLKLMALVKKQVKHKFRINLDPEIRIWQ